MQWPGDGSFWIGGGSGLRRYLVEDPLQKFDLAAALFTNPKRKSPKTVGTGWAFGTKNTKRKVILQPRQPIRYRLELLDRSSWLFTGFNI